MSDDALVRLSKLVRVSGYRRTSSDGNSSRVSSYVRKDLDSAGFGSSKTRKGAFAPMGDVGRDQGTLAEGYRSRALEPDDGTVADTPANRRMLAAHHAAMEAKRAGDKPKVNRFRLPQEDRKFAKRVPGMTDDGVTTKAVWSAEFNRTFQGTGAERDLFVAAVVAARAKRPDLDWDHPQNMPVDVLKLLDLDEATKRRLRAKRGIWGGAYEFSNSEDSDTVSLAKVTRVEAHTRHSTTGGTEHVDSYLRKVLDHFGGVNAKTRRGLFSQSADLDADSEAYTSAMGDALDGKAVRMPQYKTRESSVRLPVADLAKDPALKRITDADALQAKDDVKHPGVKRLLAKTPIPVLANAFKNLRTATSAKAHRLMALTFAALVVRQEKMAETAEGTATAFDLSDPLEGVVEAVHQLLEAVEPMASPVFESIGHAIGLSAEEISLAGRLDWSPKKNWVEKSGGLPKYIEDIALALIRDHGMTREHAIPVAINRVKQWARGGGGVKPDTVAKASAALAAWEKLKAKSHAS